MKTHKNFTYVVAESDFDGYGKEFADYLANRFPSLTIDFILRQSGGSGLFSPEFDYIDPQPLYWDDFCNS